MGKFTDVNLGSPRLATQFGRISGLWHAPIWRQSRRGSTAYIPTAHMPTADHGKKYGDDNS
jgi:hypothetical protein